MKRRAHCTTVQRIAATPAMPTQMTGRTGGHLLWVAGVDTADDDDGSRGDCKDCVQHNRDDRDGEEEAKVHVDLALRCAILVLHHEFCVVVLYRWCT